MSDYHPIVIELRDEILTDVHDLDTAVHNALKHKIPEMTKHGIKDGKTFLDFADWLVRGWIPTESTNGQDIYYVISIFYFVFAQEPLKNHQTEIHHKNVNRPLTPLSDWVVRFAKTIGEWMSSPESWNEASLASFRNSSAYRLHEAEDPQNWKCFNDFFHRKLKKPREIHAPDDDHVVTFPSDGTFAGAFDITDESEVIVKNVPWKVTDLLGPHGEKQVPGDLQKMTYGELYKNGVWMHTVLNTFDYHRQHAPISGKIEVVDVIPGVAHLEISVKKSDKVEGHSYLAPCRGIHPNANKKDPDSVHAHEAPETPGYQFLQNRGVIIINNEKIGRVVLLPVGMAMVSSINVNKHLLGKHVKKGDELSHFAFGGSDIIMIFQRQDKTQESALANYQDTINKYKNKQVLYGQKLTQAQPLPVKS